MNAMATAPLEIKTLTPLSEDEHRKLIYLIGRGHPELSGGVIEQIAEETAIFLQAVASEEDVPATPSLMVDIGWHAFFTDHGLYAEFFAARNLSPVLHCPTYPWEGTTSTITVRDTFDALSKRGWPLNSELWPANAADGRCSKCNCSRGRR